MGRPVTALAPHTTHTTRRALAPRPRPAAAPAFAVSAGLAVFAASTASAEPCLSFWASRDLPGDEVWSASAGTSTIEPAFNFGEPREPIAVADPAVPGIDLAYVLPFFGDGPRFETCDANPAADATIELWLRIDDTTGTRILLEAGSARAGVTLYAHGTRPAVWISAEAPVTPGAPAPPTAAPVGFGVQADDGALPTGWRHVVVVIHRSGPSRGVDLFIDTALVASRRDDGTGALVPPFADFAGPGQAQLGGIAGEAALPPGLTEADVQPLAAAVAGLRWFNHAWTQADIDASAQAQRGEAARIRRLDQNNDGVLDAFDQTRFLRRYDEAQP